MTCNGLLSGFKLLALDRVPSTLHLRHTMHVLQLPEHTAQCLLPHHPGIAGEVPLLTWPSWHWNGRYQHLPCTCTSWGPDLRPCALFTSLPVERLQLFPVCCGSVSLPFSTAGSSGSSWFARQWGPRGLCPHRLVCADRAAWLEALQEEGFSLLPVSANFCCN